jgi:hypothetical protein
MGITGFVLADEDVSAPGPRVETGADVPGYSGGLAATPLFWIWLLSSGSESTSLPSTDPTPSVSGDEGALPTIPGCNLGNPPGNIFRVLKTRRIVSVSRTSTTAFLMRCAFRIGRRAYGMDGMATSGVVSAV